MINIYEQLVLILLNSVFGTITGVCFIVYLKKSLVKYFYYGSLVFLFYVGSTVLNVQLNTFDINVINIIFVAFIIALTILSLIKYVYKVKLKWLP